MARKSGTNSRVRFEVELIGDQVTCYRREDSATGTGAIAQRSFIFKQKSHFHSDVIPWYDPDNSEPEYLMRLISDNPTLLGLILTKCTILHGQGLTLMEVDDNGEKKPIPRHKWPEDVADWYDYSDLNNETYKWFCDYEMLGNVFPHMIFTRGSSQASKQIAEIYRHTPDCVRALKADDATKPISRYIIAPKWDQVDGSFSTQVRAYNRKAFYDRSRRFAPGSTGYSSVLWHIKRDLPAYPHYGIPHWYGARFHIELQNEIPRLHIANIINQWGARMMVSVSKDYIASMMQHENPDTEKKYTEDEIKAKIAKTVKDLVTKPENTGRSLLTSHVYDHQGRPMKDIFVEQIKVDMKDDAYAKLDEFNNNKVTSSVGVQAALASLITSKGMSSGSELTQAWNIETAKALNTQQKILAPILFAWRYNGWAQRYKNYTWGFANPSLVTQDIAKEGMITKPEVPDPQKEEKPKEEE